MLFRSFLPFLIWFFRAVESSGLSSSKLHSSSPDTDIMAPQLSNSPQYYRQQSVNTLFFTKMTNESLVLTLGAEKTVTKIRS